MNFNALKSYCIAFTPKLYKLTLQSLHINSLPISYTDSIKQGRPQDLAGGGKNFFFSDFEICMS